MKPPKKYFIVSGTYNADQYVGKCIDSVNEQVADDFDIVHVVVNDGSTDNTAEVINKHAGLRQVVISHPKNAGPIQSQLDGFAYAREHGDPHDVVVQLDGDDWFARSDALQIVHQTYLKTDCGATYGNYICTDGAASCCRIPDWDNLRKDLKKNGWPFSHLRTFRSGYTEHIQDRDLRDEDGEYYISAYDAALFLPITEMAGRDKVTFINHPLVSYNRHNPIRDGRIRYFDQIRCANSCYSNTPFREVAL